MIDAHFDRLIRLLDLESAAQARREAEQARRFSGAEAVRTGNTLIDLRLVDENAGLGGRYILQLARPRRAALPWTRLDVGSPILLSPNDDASRPWPSRGSRGVICQKDDHAVSVALTELPDELGDVESWRMDLAGDNVASQRQRSALLRAKSARANRLAQLRDVLLGLRPPAFDPEKNDRVEFDPGLNEPQRESVRMALSARDVALIHGPPGTGKTTTVVEFVHQAVKRGQKVLACAPSNLAVDNLLERLLAKGERAVRLGHPARVLPQLRENTLDLLVEEHEDVRLSHKLIKEAMQLFRRADRFTRAKPAPGEKREMRQEARALLDDARRLEAQAVQHILDRADVLCATTTALDDGLLGDRRFDLAVIDEACQSTEPGCWIPLLRCEKVVLAGDHCQLPPTILSREADEHGFGVSLFERLMDLGSKTFSKKLTVQYRMHEAIMSFSSREFYHRELIADESVRGHRLHDIEAIAAAPITELPVEFIDTAGAEYDEEIEPDGESRRNPREATLAVYKAKELLNCGVAPGDVAIISPYSAQVRLLREMLPIPDLEIDSVDGFQGREKEAIILSLVRSNANGEIGFLGELRRMNVALTRARRKLLIVGDSATLGRHAFYSRLLEHCDAVGGYRSVWEETLD